MNEGSHKKLLDMMKRLILKTKNLLKKKLFPNTTPSFRALSEYSGNGFPGREIVSLINASFNNAVSKSMYHLVPFIVVFSLPVGKNTDILLFLYEIYIFFSWTLTQSYEYVFTAHLTKESSKCSVRTLLFATLKKTLLISTGLYLFYIGILFFVLPVISGFAAEENFNILKDLVFLGIGFVFGTSSAIFVSALTIKRFFSPVTFATFAGLTTYALLFLFFQPILGSTAFILSIVAGELIKFVLLFLFTHLKIRDSRTTERPKRDFKEDLTLWKNIMLYFASTVLAGFVPMVLSSYATHLTAGSLTMLSFSLRLFYIMGGFFNGALSLLLVIWIEVLGKDVSKGIAKIDNTLKSLFLLSFLVVFLVISCKGLVLALISPQKEIITLLNQSLNIIFSAFPFYVLYLVFNRVLIAVKKVYLITILSSVKLVLLVAVLGGGDYTNAMNSLLPFVAFAVSEVLVAITTCIIYISLRGKKITWQNIAR